MPSSLPPPSKKRKLSTPGSSVRHVEKLEFQVTEAITSNTSLNPIADILDIASSEIDPEVETKAIYALYRIFVSILGRRMLHGPADDDAKVVRAWITEKLNAYTDLLCALLQDEEKILRTSALQILFSLQKHLSSALTSSTPPSSLTSYHQPQFHVPHFKKIAYALLFCPPSTRVRSSKRMKDEEGRKGPNSAKLDPDVRDLFVKTWWSVHDDVRWLFLREAGSLLLDQEKRISRTVGDNLLSLLERLDTFPTEQEELNAWWVEEFTVKPPKPKKNVAGEEEDKADEGEAEDEDEDDWRKFFDDDKDALKGDDGKKSSGPAPRLYKLTVHQSLHSLASHRAMFTRCWLALLPHLSGSNDEALAMCTRALNVMHRGVMPHLTKAVMVMDWVAGCVDHGGSVGLLALNSLFILMKDYNLDYPSFYTRLYSFVNKDVLHLKHRARFFRLTDTFLSSTHLPATLLASFVKRLSRLSLSAPPAAIIMLVPFTYNILKRHPALMVMIHRPGPRMEDPFDMNETNPTLTRALESSLWELYSHKNHYHAPVSTLVKIFDEPFTKPSYAMEDFLDHTYATLFETEVKRRIKKEPALADELPKHLFPTEPLTEEDSLALTNSDVISQLWTFGSG